MYFALGLLVAGLLALVVTPAIWRRAMRLARTRIEANVPLTRAEIDADKDQLRAGFAVASRRLEIEAARLKHKLAEGAIALGRRNEEIAALTRDKAGLAEAARRLEARATELAAATTEAERKLATAAAELALREATLAEREATVARLQASLDAKELMTEELRLEMVARATEIANLGDRLNVMAANESASSADRDRAGAELAAERERMTAEQKRIAALEASFAALQAERAGRMAEIERRATQLRAYESEIAVLRRERDEAVEALAHARSETVDGDNLGKALAATETANTDLQLRLSALEDDLAALRAENADLRQVSGAEWESDREENRRLRERLNEIAAGVVRLTQSLEAAAPSVAHDSPAEPIPMTGPRAPAPPAESEGTLADRLHALQHAGARH